MQKDSNVKTQKNSWDNKNTESYLDCKEKNNYEDSSNKHRRDKEHN